MTKIISFIFPITLNIKYSSNSKCHWY